MNYVTEAINIVQMRAYSDNEYSILTENGQLMFKNSANWINCCWY